MRYRCCADCHGLQLVVALLPGTLLAFLAFLTLLVVLAIILPGIRLREQGRRRGGGWKKGGGEEGGEREVFLLGWVVGKSVASQAIHEGC